MDDTPTPVSEVVKAVLSEIVIARLEYRYCT
jgi:hypothetical protein